MLRVEKIYEECDRGSKKCKVYFELESRNKKICTDDKCCNQCMSKEGCNERCLVLRGVVNIVQENCST